MTKKRNWSFKSFEELQDCWDQDKFDCDDVADFRDSLILDWCSRLEDWTPKIAVCFNRYTSAVTLDRISQHEMPELRRLVCFHQNCSVQTLERLLEDSDYSCRQTALEYLNKADKSYRPKKSRKKVARR